jgi:hypothetical protein
MNLLDVHTLTFHFIKFRKTAHCTNKIQETNICLNKIQKSLLVFSERAV